MPAHPAVKALPAAPRLCQSIYLRNHKTTCFKTYLIHHLPDFPKSGPRRKLTQGNKEMLMDMEPGVELDGGYLCRS